MKLKSKLDELIEKRLNARFQKLVNAGLLARDVTAVKLSGEARKRLVLLCTCNHEVYAVVCTNTHKANSISYFELLGSYIKAQKGIVEPNLVALHGTYEGYQAHLVIAQDVAIRKN